MVDNHAENDKIQDRNDNLQSAKSTAAPREEAKQEKRIDEQHLRPLTDLQTDEVKSTRRLLPEDAEKKSRLSEESGL